MADIIDLMLATGCRIGEILALRWSDLDLDGDLPILTVLLRERRQFATPSENDAVFATRKGTWHQVVNVERRWRQTRKDTGFEWVTPPHVPQDGGDANLRGNNVRPRLAATWPLLEPGHPGPLHRQAPGLGRPFGTSRQARSEPR